MMNPCHIILLVEAYLLLQPKSQTNDIVYANFVSNLFSPWCGLVFAIDVGLEGPYEMHMYWFEHIISAIINPLVLTFAGRYRNREFFDVSYRAIGYAYFSMYHRGILLPLSLATWANLDQTLRHGATDPFYPFLGDWYYLGADFYCTIPSLIIAYSYLVVSELIYYLQDLFGYTKSKIE